MKQMHCRLAVLMAERDPSLSQRKIAEATGLGKSTVGRLFNNSFDRVDRKTVEKLCDYFRLDQITDLFVLRSEDTQVSD
jgi:putative transcriptional regulator